MMNNQTILKKGEKLEDLQLDGLEIIQSEDLYRFTSDAVILANFVRAKPSDILLDLGTGSGIIAILATYKNNLNTALGIDIQPNLVDMATRSVMHNNLSDRISILELDMKQLLSAKEVEKFGFNRFDVITCNPPYKKEGTAKKVNQNESQSIARHEVAITLNQICKVASNCLKFRGKFYVCLDADRTAELVFDLKSNGLEPKRMFFTQSSEKSEAKIVFVEAVKGGKEGVRVLPMLITNDRDGAYLNAVKKLKF